MRKPNTRERDVLNAFVFDIPEPWGNFPDAGPKTRASMLEEGWIELNEDPTYPHDYYQITPAGKIARDS
ncbi:hypothetical protein [Haematobacter genomosp. 1]|uniref:Uncharacterized protein n=1 Tax=Haematobacter genomosp. 1 TaxID=366618 RepID=A0A212ACC0_9RHOB|nr:hypothetical protein [Haematobacter genomosp. 1]OWJ78554.1 hypothetical protein CDV49_09030 [Haematobacter genomosp. 1]